MEGFAFLFIFTLIASGLVISLVLMKILSFVFEMCSEVAYKVSDMSTPIKEKTKISKLVLPLEEATPTKENISQDTPRFSEPPAKRLSEVLTQVHIGNTLPLKFRVIDRDINKYLSKIEQKKEALDMVQLHRFDTLKKDYQTLLSTYFGYDRSDRLQLEDSLAEGLIGLQMKLESIYVHVMDDAKYRMNHRIEVIGNR